MKLSYLPGCTLKTKASDLDKSTISAMKALDIEDIETASLNQKEDLVDFITDNFLITIMSEQKANFTRGELKTAVGVHLAGAVTYMTHE